MLMVASSSGIHSEHLHCLKLNNGTIQTTDISAGLFERHFTTASLHFTAASLIFLPLVSLLLHGLLPGPFRLSYSVFVFICFYIFFHFCAVC